MRFGIAVIISLMMTMFASVSVDGQGGATTGGSIVVAGSGSITSYKHSSMDNRRFTVDINPRIGFFIIDGLAVNGNLQFERQSVETIESTGWGIGPGLTYYFLNPGSRLHPFLTARSLFRWLHTTWESYPAEGWHSDITWLAGGGVMVMLVKQVGLSTEVFYQRTEHDFEPDRDPPTISETYGVRFGVAAFVF